MISDYAFIFKISVVTKMRNSPRKRGTGAVACNTPVEIFTTHQLLKIPLGELRNLASEKHGIQVNNRMLCISNCHT